MFVPFDLGDAMRFDAHIGGAGLPVISEESSRLSWMERCTTASIKERRYDHKEQSGCRATDIVGDCRVIGC